MLGIGLVLLQALTAPGADGVFFQAHRGGMLEVPENTLAAFRHAWSCPGAVPEVDVTTSKDRELVCIHDDTLARTTDAPEPVSKTPVWELTAEQIRQWDAGVKFGGQYAGEKVPLLSEVLEMMREAPERRAYLDLKRVDLEQLAAMLREYGVMDRVIFVHGNPAELARLQGLFPGAQTMTWLSGSPARIKSGYEQLLADKFKGISQLQFHLNVSRKEPDIEYFLDKEFLARALRETADAGVALQVRPMDFDVKSLGKLIDLGIRWFVADEPRRFADTVAAHQAPPTVDKFSDGVKHYRDGSGSTEYGRYAAEQVREIAENVLLYQRSNGGWPPNRDPLRVLSGEEKAQLLAEKDKRDTSFDNRTTYTQVEYLAGAHNQTGDPLFLDGCLRGLEFILNAQYENGGFPHSWPDSGNYRPHITFMDDVMTGTLATLRRAAAGAAPFGFLDKALRERAADAVRRGDALILRLQQTQNGEPAVWAGQYDRETLQPVMARTFELPSLVSAESVNVVRYLMSIEPPTPEIVRAVNGAVKWFGRSAIRGLRIERVPAETVRYEHHTSDSDVRAVEDPDAPRIWARFYELDTNRPFMANRDGVKVYSLAEVDRERRTGYAWYGGAPEALLSKEYPAWVAKWGVAPGEK
ncbi:MAG: pectate lyase [Candidatus Hydrogenedens sp.]|nr:pectate lyase [Candidatus Hydrogenedentota bacterium]NLF58698.1 pectate lyase [Candidatus Hydrogenedens sp.]